MLTLTDNTVPVTEAYRMLRDGDVVVDVREPLEHATGTVPDALRIPLAQLPHRRADLPADRRLLVICATGNRSTDATRMLRHSGFDVRNVGGGMAAWTGAGLPVSR